MQKTLLPVGHARTVFHCLVDTNYSVPHYLIISILFQCHYYTDTTGD